MKLYSNKRRWKLILFLFACVIVIVSLIYSNVIIQNIAKEERSKVKLWAEALKRKSTLVQYTQELFDKLTETERQKVELWSEATRLLASADYQGDFGFLLKVIADNTTIPIILTDQQGQVVSFRNILIPDSNKIDSFLNQELVNMQENGKKIVIEVYQGRKNYLYYQESRIITELRVNMHDLIQSFISEIVINNASLPVLLVEKKSHKIIAFGNIPPAILEDSVQRKQLIQDMSTQNPPISITLSNAVEHLVYYNNSITYQRLKYYPLIQFLVIGLFIFFSYLLFNSYRTSEQNQVWAGMAKETAHQLGTPISSLIGWLEYLKLKDIEIEILPEIEKDVQRLQVVADRFSKIGSLPELQQQDILPILKETVEYMQKRCSSNILIRLENTTKKKSEIFINKALLTWVIENLIRNAIDSMESGKGLILIQLSHLDGSLCLDITDNGKGIPSHKVKEVFKPGYTTKARGWGLGLSLSKRIIEEYHRGKIFVKASTIAAGTTFRILLKS